MRRAIWCLGILLLAGCGSDDSDGASCVLDDINGEVICESAANNLECSAFTYNDANLTCRVSGCGIECSTDRCGYLFDEVPTRAECVAISVELACASSAFDVDFTCSVGGCVVCDDTDTDFDGDFDFDGDIDSD